MKEESLLEILDARFEFVCRNNILPLLIEVSEGVKEVLLTTHYSGKEEDIIEVDKLVPCLLRDNPIYSCKYIDVEKSIEFIDYCQSILDMVMRSESNFVTIVTNTGRQPNVFNFCKTDTVEQILLEIKNG